MNALHTLSAATLARLLRAGEISSVAIVEALHARADEVEPRVGALCHQFRKRALSEARRADEARANGASLPPLHGLPITIKENIDTEGVPSTMGLRARQGHPAARDAVSVRLLREAGSILLAKTNVPQTLLCSMETTNTLFGTTHNPWRHGYGPGGSSGGEAAAIASGSSLFGVGSDIGGSIRGPASFCGTCGLKPTFGRWSNAGSRGILGGQEIIRAQIGPMARDVDDLTLLMRAIETSRHAAVDPLVPPVPMGDPAHIDPTTLRVGFYEDDGYFAPAASVRRAVREAAERLERSGVEVVRFQPPNVEELLRVYLQGISADGAMSVDQALEGEPFIQPLRTLGRIARMPKRARSGLATALSLMGETRVQAMLESIGEKRVIDVWRLAQRRTELQREEAAAWDREGVDIVLAPTYVTPACQQGLSHDFTLGFLNLARYNLLDRPAGVVPVSRVRPDETVRSNLRDRLEKRAAQIESESDGLPLGVQLVGKPWQEAPLLAMMKLLHDVSREDALFPKTPVDPAVT